MDSYEPKSCYRRNIQQCFKNEDDLKKLINEKDEPKSCYRRNIQQCFKNEDDLKKLNNEKVSEDEEFEKLLQEAPEELRKQHGFNKMFDDVKNGMKGMKAMMLTCKKTTVTEETDNSSAIAAPEEYFFEKLWGYIKGTITSLFQMVWDNIKNLFTAIKDFFSNIFGY